MSQSVVCTSCGLDLSGSKYAYLYKFNEHIYKEIIDIKLENECCRVQFFSKLQPPVRNITIKPELDLKYSEISMGAIK